MLFSPSWLVRTQKTHPTVDMNTDTDTEIDMDMEMVD